MESLVAFSPSTSPTSPVNYSVAINVQGTTQIVKGSITSQGQVSPLCRPLGSTVVGDSTSHGILAAQFMYPNGALSFDFGNDAQNCGACGVVCDSTQVCRNSACVESGFLQIKLSSWDRVGDMDLYVFPPVFNTRVTWGDMGAGDTTAWGRLEVQSDVQGPEITFWNQTRIIAGSTHPTPSGEYIVCLETADFFPSVSSTNPVSYSLQVTNLTTTRTFNGTFTTDTFFARSDECRPVGSAVDSEFHSGVLVAKITYPNI